MEGYSNSRTGFEVTAGATLGFLVAVALAALLLALFGGPYTSALGESIGAGVATSDRIRIATAVSTLEGIGTGRQTITLDNSYTEITVGTDKITLNRDDLQETVALPPEFDYQAPAEISGTDLCIQKQGRQYTFFDSQCTRTSCSQGTCTTFPGVDGPARGYQCSSGAYTDEAFFKHYYSSTAAGCGGDVDNTFVHINKLSCPDKLEAGHRGGCVVTATWRCQSDTAGIGLSADGAVSADEQLLGACDGDIRHERLPLYFTAADDANGDSIDVEAIVGIPAGTVSSTVQETIEVVG